MAKPRLARTKQRIEFGDFQTPDALARRACEILSERGIEPATLLEPTCGKGSFLAAAIEMFPSAASAFGLDINPRHVESAHQQIQKIKPDTAGTIVLGDFFTFDWKTQLAGLPDPLLIIGNPPWVTNSELSRIGSSNLPVKSNFKRHRGIDALTGKSNFDISEWMLLQMAEWINGRDACLAMVCKTSVARKILLHCWRNGIQLQQADLYRIDSNRYFGAAVEACFMVLKASLSGLTFECGDYSGLEATEPSLVFGYRDGELIADVKAYAASRHLQGEIPWQWRSGIKHDCSRIFEFSKEGSAFRNGLGQLVELESDYLYPLLKSSDLANGSLRPSRWMLVPQRSIGELTDPIQQKAPRTWQYLMEHKELLDKRGSSIYKNRPPFSIFGVGEYAFAPWKVAISGFYKSLRFRLIGPFHSKPIVVDDTCYFLPCQDRKQGEIITELLNSTAAQNFFSSFIFWDAKRPITGQLLQRLDILTLAKQLELDDSKTKCLLDATSKLRHSNKASVTQGFLSF